MDSNWKIIEEKWPHYRVDENDARFLDVSECKFIGEGLHEIAIYTFGRYFRSYVRYPICVCFGSHFPDFVSIEEPSLGYLRSRLTHEKTGMPEPILMLAIVSTNNGRLFWDILLRELDGMEIVDSERDNERWILSDVDSLFEACEKATSVKLESFVEEPRSDSCWVSISSDELSEEPFSIYSPSIDELVPSRQENWIYPLKREIKDGGDGRQAERERVVLITDLRRVDESLHIGQLGWTIPDPGFVLKKGSTSIWIEVDFDSKIRLLVDVYWIEFLRANCAKSVSEKIVQSCRNTPYDADMTVATKWEPDFPFYQPSELTIMGNGLEEIYAYTYLSCINEEKAKGANTYPMKIGFARSDVGAIGRVVGQFPEALEDDVRIQFIGRCDDGRATESRIHAHLKKDKRHMKTAPGSEWFLTTADEIRELFLKYKT